MCMCAVVILVCMVYGCAHILEQLWLEYIVQAASGSLGACPLEVDSFCCDNLLSSEVTWHLYELLGIAARGARLRLVFYHTSKGDG